MYDLRQASANLRALKQEKKDLPQAMNAASQSGDADQFLALAARQRDLPAHIFAAEIKVMRAEISELDAELAAAAPTALQLRLNVALLEQAHQAAATNLRLAWQKNGDHDAQLKERSRRRSELRRLIEDRIAEQSRLATATPVFSLQHA